MSEPAVFVLIRDGQVRCYGDRWAGTFLYRELLWGPDDFESWVSKAHEVDDALEEECPGIVADFDLKTLTWAPDSESDDKPPRTLKAIDQMISTAWSGWEVVRAGPVQLLAAAGQEFETDDPDQDPLDYREATVAEAHEMFVPDDDFEDEDEEGEEQEGDESTRAWVSLVDGAGNTCHCHLEEISRDLFTAEPKAIDQLARLALANVPDERLVSEGMWIDADRKEIGIWGGESAKRDSEAMRNAWAGWDVRWTDDGYAEHCRVANVPGVALSDAEALGPVIQIALSTKRFDPATVFGAMGGSIKKTAIKAVGCLTMIVCLPVLLFGLISGNMKAAGITIAVVCFIVFVIFKVLELKVKRKIGGTLGHLQSQETEMPPTAGPMTAAERRGRIDTLLVRSSLPTLVQVAPHFPADGEFSEFL